MKAKSVEEIEEFLRPIADEVGVEIVETEFKISKNSYLTVYIDTENGVDLDTCERFHNAISDRLDELDPTFGAPYTLNVSSPGLDRPFKKERDYKKALGEKVEVKLFAPQNGKKTFVGVLEEYDGNSVIVRCGDAAVKFPLTKIAKICRYIDFD